MFGLFKQKERLKSPQEKFQEAEQKVQDAFIMFSQAHDAVDEADKMIIESKEENEKILQSLKAQVVNVENDIVRAEDNLQANKALKERLLDFIPKGRD